MSKKTVLSQECQESLEEIFALFGNREEAQQNPEVCLEAVLGSIAEDLSDMPGSATLVITLNFARPRGGAAIHLEWLRKRRQERRERQERRRQKALGATKRR